MDSIGFQIQHIATVLSRNADQILLEQLGIGYSQFKILVQLRDAPSTQQKHMALALGQTEASVSRQLKLLESADFIAVRINPNNRREHRTELTPKGQRITQKAISLLNEYYAPAFASLSEKQQAKTKETLDTLHQSICSAH